MTGEKTKQTGVLVVTHVDYGEKLVQAAKFILGEFENVQSIGVDVSHDVELMMQAIRDGIEAVDTGNGVLILTDMFGGTPTNLSLSLLGSAELEVITGVSLPMLLKVLGARELSPEELAKVARDAGMQGIVVAGEVLRKKIADG